MQDHKVWGCSKQVCRNWTPTTALHWEENMFPKEHKRSLFRVFWDAEQRKLFDNKQALTDRRNNCGKNPTFFSYRIWKKQISLHSSSCLCFFPGTTWHSQSHRGLHPKRRVHL